MSRIYAGIGSRKTPSSVLEKMELVAEVLGRRGWTLRSGGADGADSAFERGCDNVRGRKEIYLPWSDFNGRKAGYHGPKVEAFDLASTLHPAWNRCSASARKMHARNMHQVMGWDLNTPCDVVICWTPGGRMVGGTAQALRLALVKEIPILNLGSRAGILAAREWWATHIKGK